MDTTSEGKIGKYEIIRVLGRGGMGEVVLAQDRDLGRRVAIKRPFKTANGEGFARFQVEARAATLRHPNIPAVYEMGEQDGLPFIAMEFVEGEALDKVISSGRPLDLIQKLSVIEQVCSALGHAHEKGIIHRDIKPANVILQADGVAKIIDFGIAKIMTPDANTGLTQTSQIIGSLHYIAPERFKGETVDGRSDIFSAGVMLYLLLTGKLPFTGGEETAFYKIVNEAATPLGAHLHEYPPALDAIMDQALAKNPNLRYSTAEDFADALHEVIEELKRGRVAQLFDDAERLTTESRYAPALELLDEAMKLDPANTQVRKLRKFVREHQDRSKRAERVRELIRRSDEMLAQESFAEALSALKEAQAIDPAMAELGTRMQAAEEQKRRYEITVNALAAAAAARERGDITGALRTVEKRLKDDPENAKLQSAMAVLAKQAEREAQKGKLEELLEQARNEVGSRHFSAVDGLLLEAEALDPSHPEIDKLRREVARIKELEERRQLLEEIQKRVNEFVRTDNFDAATDLVNRAIEKLPTEGLLHRLKAEVDAEAGKFQAKRLVEDSIAAARELFATEPMEALSLLQKAIEQAPGEERLIAYAKSLREQFDTLRVDQIHESTLRQARELLAAKEYDKAIVVLESFQLEFGSHTDVDELAKFAKDELAQLRRRSVIERCLNESRALIQSERLEDAIRLLEAGVRETKDASLTRLLEEVRGRQAESAKKLDVLQKRVTLLRDRGELDESIKLVKEYLSGAPTPHIQELLKALEVERQQKQATRAAITAAQQATQKREFSAGLDALQAVIRAYGESAELTQAVEALQAAKAAYAQEVVGNSIDTARAALLKNDAEGALTALKSAAALVEFADQKKQADWQRILVSVKKALPDATLEAPASVAAPSRGMPMWMIAAAALVVVVGGGGLVWKILHPTVPLVEAHIVIAKAPEGASVTIDGGAAVKTDANGDLSVVVKPGPHHVVVSKDGFTPFVDDVTVGTGETYRDPAILTALPVATLAGTLTVRGNLADFKVFVDGVSRGTIHEGAPIILEAGPHKIRYTAPGYIDSAEKTVQVALQQDTKDSFTLEKMAAPPPNVGNLVISTNPGAHISLDGGHSKGTADQNGNYTISSLAPGQHFVDISLDGFQSIQEKPVDVAAGQNRTANAVMTAVQPTLAYFRADQTSIESGSAVTLSWQINNASSAAIDGIGSVSPTGVKTVSPEQTTTYKLSANGGGVLQSVTVNVKAKAVAVVQVPSTPAVVVTPSAPATTAAAGPDRGALEAGLAAYKNIFKQASGTSSNACKGVFNGAYQGRLKGLTSWCDLAKGFDVTENCASAVGGSQDAPTLSCSETVTINMKDSGSRSAANQRVFQYAKNPDGTWRIIKW